MKSLTIQFKMDDIIFLILLCISGFISSLNAATVERIYKHDNKPALKGSNIQLVCDISQFEAQVGVFKTDSRLPDSVSGIQTLTYCNPSLCLTMTSGRYIFSADSSKIYINITNINRSEDQKWWACTVGNQRKDLQLTVFTVPQTLQYDNSPSEDQDLAQNAVTLKCSTGCSYPQPSFTWYYTESGGSQQVWTSTSASVTNKAGGCSDSERIYTSTLSLVRYTTFSRNVEKTVKFICGIPSFTGISQPLNTNSSVNIQFAVRVTSVTLKDGTSTPSNPLQVVSGVFKTLTCTASTSRPAATIVWYIGTVEKQRSRSSFTFTPQNSDHDKQIYCKAFNTQPESQAVSSNKVTLYVQVQVTSITLKDGPSTPSNPLQVVSSVSKTLTCTTSVSRPSSTIVWYIGTVEKQRSSSSFTFTPQNSDHNKQIYCKAFNTQPESQAVSSNKATLYVQVHVTSVTLKYGNTTPQSILEAISGVSITLTCTTSVSRPTATIIWFIGSDEKKRSIGSTSSLTFTPDYSDHADHVFCKAFNLQMENQAVMSNKPSLFIKEPSVVKSFYIGERNGQANVTVDEHDVAHFTCEVGGDPASNVKITFKGEILAEHTDTNELTFIRKEVNCFHSGVYFCEGTNSYELTSSKNTTLLVKCFPRPRWQILRNITSPLYVPVTLTFTAIAYPEPGPKGFSWYKETENRWIPLMGNEDLRVSSSDLQTSLTILNVSQANFGQYRVTVENSIGTYDQYLFLSGEGLTVEGTGSSTDKTECTTSVIVAIILGISCVVLAAYATGITISYKRKIIREGMEFPDKKTTQTTYVNSAYKPDDTKQQERTQGRDNIATGIDEDSLKQYTDLAQFSRGEITTYDIIQKV